MSPQVHDVRVELENCKVSLNGCCNDTVDTYECKSMRGIKNSASALLLW